MDKVWMVITAASIIGFYVPTFVAFLSPHKTEVGGGVNLLFALAAGLLAAYFV